MFTALGRHARLSCQQDTDLQMDMVCEAVLFLCLEGMDTGPCSQHMSID